MKIKYISWRNGRPRFEPGSSMRDRGLKGYDLRHENGKWYSEDEAKAESEKIGLTARSAKPPTTPQANSPEKIIKLQPKMLAKNRRLRKPNFKGNARRMGYVYVLVIDDKMKIGFSQKPWDRITKMMTLMPVSPRIIIMPGTMLDEGRLQWRMRRYHLEAEWFQATDGALRKLALLFASRRWPWPA